MSRRWWGGLAGLCAAGFLLRATVAVVDAAHPAFPPHYYNDERNYLEKAEELAEGRSRGALSPGKEAYSTFLALLWRHVGPGPLPGRLANAAMGSAAIGLWGWTSVAITGPTGGLAAAAFLCLWPSNVFHSAQAIKEAPASLLLALGTALLCGGFTASGSRRQTLFFTAALSILALGFLRAYLLPLIVAATVAAAAAAWAASGRRERVSCLAAVLWMCGALIAYRPAKLALQMILSSERNESAVSLLPPDFSLRPPESERAPNALQTLATYRKTLVMKTILWNQQVYGRAPESALWPEAEFRTWGDLFVFIPKASFYELFMPLPGLYPMQGKPGRMLAASEGLILLLVFVLAAAGLRRTRMTPAAWFLCAFFLFAVPPTAFLEYDLGSASRHRTHFFPFILPFAVAMLHRQRSAP